MSLFNDASLVVIPSGYKTSKVYSVKPTDGTGDLTFTRTGDTATRVGPNGLIEKVRTNLAVNSVWAGVGTGVAPTSWSAFDPNFSAGPSAGQIRFNTTANRGYIFQAFVVSAGEYTQSFYVDSVTTGEPLGSIMSIVGVTSTNVVFYEDGVVVSSATIPTAGKRYARKSTLTAGTAQVRFGSGVNSATTGDWVGSRPQFEAGDIATDYIATTSAAVSVGPVANVPRLDYLGSSCPRLLLEPQRTNDITNNTALNNYTATRATWGVNVGVAPTGYQEAEKLIEDTTASNSHFFGIGGSYVSGTAYTWSIYVKADGRDEVLIQAGNQATFPLNCIFNLSTQTVTNSGSGTGAIIDAGNGWYRLVVRNVVALATGSTNYNFYLRSGGNVTYTGNGTSGVLVWGVQREAAAYETSIIPTLGASVTRGADVGSSSFTGLTTTSGSLFFDLAAGFNGDGINSGVASLGLRLSSTGTNDSVGLRDATIGTLQGVIRVGGSSTNLGATISGTAATKVCFVWTASTIKMFKDGALYGSASISTPAVFNTVDLPNSSRVIQARLNQMLVFPTALTDQQAIELTA